MGLLIQFHALEQCCPADCYSKHFAAPTLMRIPISCGFVADGGCCMWAVGPVIYVVLKLLATASISFNLDSESQGSPSDSLLPLLHAVSATPVLSSGLVDPL